MKYFFPFLFFPFLLPAQVNFFEGSFEEAKAEAARSGKLLFVDVYTTWCGPCRRMESYTFSDPEVGRLMNGFFINYRLDAEGAYRSIAKSLEVKGYPTLLFLTPAGVPFDRQMGFMDNTTFSLLAEAVLRQTSYYQTYRAFEEAWRQGRREPSFVAQWLAVQAQFGQDVDQTMKTWLEELHKDSLSLPVTEKTVAAYTRDLEGPGFEYLMMRQQQSKRCATRLIQLVERSCHAAVQTRNEQKLRASLEVVDRIWAAAPDKSALKKGALQCRFLLETGQTTAFIRFTQHFIPEQVLPGLSTALTEDWMTTLDNTIWQYVEYVEDPTALNTALEWAQKVLTLVPSVDRYDISARLAVKAGQKEVARILLQDGVTYARTHNETGAVLEKRLAEW